MLFRLARRQLNSKADEYSTSSDVLERFFESALSVHEGNLSLNTRFKAKREEGIWTTNILTD